MKQAAAVQHLRLVEPPKPRAVVPTTPAAVTGPYRLSVLPTTIDLTIYRGDDFSFSLTLTNADDTPADLTGAAFTADIRKSSLSTAAAGAFTVSVATNVVTLALSAAATAQLTGR